MTSVNRSCWQVKNEAILTELITLMNLSPAEKSALSELRNQATAIGPQMTAVFYERLLGHENTAEFLRGVSLERLHSMVQDWFVDLFCGTYNEEYARKRLNIGQIHVRIGLPVRYPLAMLDVVIPFGEAIARESSDPEKVATAFRKVLALDVAIFNQAYEDNQLSHLAELVGGERLARLLLTGAA